MSTQDFAHSHSSDGAPRRPHAVIVGGSSGIGLATAARLAPTMRVTIAGRDPARLEAARRELATEAVDVDAVSLDATDAAARTAFFRAIGPLDHLVLALGSRRGLGPLAELTAEEVEAGFREKVYPHILCAQAALPGLAAAGSITFVSAISAEAGMPGTAAIGAANAAVAALVPILASELRPVRVNGVSPGVIATPWWDFVPDEARQSAFASYAAMTPVGRVGTAEDVAETIAFLIGSSFTNGQVLTCDGGIRLRPA